MLIVAEVLVEREVVEEKFSCNLQACKGACCWEGDWGAPLELEELTWLESEYAAISPFLEPEGRHRLEEKGLYTYFPEAKTYGTTLRPNGACAYLVKDRSGIAQCGIELAHRAGHTDFPKPVSCQLYPIRAQRDPQTGMETIRYDRWDICSAACSKGEKERMPVYRFVQKGLERKFGAAWFRQLEATVAYLENEKKRGQHREDTDLKNT